MITSLGIVRLNKTNQKIKTMASDVTTPLLAHCHSDCTADVTTPLIAKGHSHAGRPQVINFGSLDCSQPKTDSNDSKSPSLLTSPQVQHFVMDRLSLKSQVNYLLAICCVLYIGINLMCLLVNIQSPEYIHEHRLAFHLTEFWATFFFGVVDLLAFTYSPKPLSNVFKHVLLAKVFIFCNVLFTFLPAVLVTFDLERFEILSHEIEYANELLLAFMDLLILVFLSKRFDLIGMSDIITFLLALVVIMIACKSIYIYIYICI